MKFWTAASLFGAVLAFGGMMFIPTVQSADTHPSNAWHIATVNVAALMEKAPQTRIASEKLKAEYAKREQELDKEKQALQQFKDEIAKQRASKTLSEADALQQERDLRSRERLYTRTQDDFTNELNASRDLALEDVQNQVFQAIEAVREQAQLDIVFKESDYIAANKSIDITDKVLVFLEQKLKTAPVSSTTKDK